MIQSNNVLVTNPFGELRHEHLKTSDAYFDKRRPFNRRTSLISSKGWGVSWIYYKDDPLEVYKAASQKPCYRHQIIPQELVTVTGGAYAYAGCWPSPAYLFSRSNPLECLSGRRWGVTCCDAQLPPSNLCPRDSNGQVDSTYRAGNWLRAIKGWEQRWLR